MDKQIQKITLLTLAAIFLFTACSPSEADQQPDAAAQTLEFVSIQETAMMGELIKLTQTAAARPPTDTPVPPRPTDTLAPILTQPTDAPGVVAPPLVGATATNPLPTGGDKAVLAGETVPDLTVFSQGTPFTKTWTLRNVGTTTWTTEYVLVFVEGVQMNAADEVLMPIPVPPGTLVEVSVPMRAPYATGTFQGNWKLRNANGQTFGVGPDGQGVFWVKIVSVATPTPE